MTRFGNERSARAGFTLVEVLVASLLLGMLLTILTMVFNSSSIAWRTGKAGVSQLSKMRRQLAVAQYNADSLLPRVDGKSKNEVGLVVSAWEWNGDIRTRAVEKMESNVGFARPSFGSLDSAKSSPGAPSFLQVNNLGSFKPGSSKNYTVGVLSYGPDGIRNTEDDITTWPIEVE